MAGDRLWIQRVPPKTGKTKGSKRKRASEKEPDKADPKVIATPAKRPRLNTKSSHPVLTPSGRYSRAAKDQAKLKLDVQAKELAELTRVALFEQKSRTFRQQPSRAPPRALGTRTSARLRGAPDGDWQSIPDEWLDVEENSKSKQAKERTQKTGLESDEDTISDLTELSEEVSESSLANPPDQGEPYEGPEEPVSDERKGPEKAEGGYDGFVEWETVQQFSLYLPYFDLLFPFRFAPTSMSGSIFRKSSRRLHITAKRLCIRHWLKILFLLSRVS